MSKIISVFFALIIAVILASFFLFTVKENELAIKFKFGEIVRTNYNPGLHWRIPIYNNVVKLDKRIQTLDNEPEPVLNTDKEYLMVDYFVKWKIEDPRTFYTSNQGGQIAVANDNLSSVFKNALREQFLKRTLEQVISTQRVEVMRFLREQITQIASDYGMEIVDVRIKRINLDDAVSNSVFTRMRSERQAEAAEHRSEGRKESINIRANTDKRVRIMLAEAEKEAAITRGEGDAEAASLFAESYNRNPEFYAFLRSLEAYGKSFAANGSNVLVLDPKSEFFQYFNQLQQGEQ